MIYQQERNMGMSIDALLIYGADYGEVSEVEGIDEMLDSGEIEYASPYYDAPRDEWIVGIALPSEIDGAAEMTAAIREAKEEFERLTNDLTGRIIVSPHIT